MDDDARGAFGAAPGFGGSRGATASPPSRRQRALAALVGLVVAAVPSLGAHLLPQQTIRDAGEHARPLIALVLVAPLAAVMVVAATADWLRGKGSPLAAVRQLSAIALVMACFFAAVQGMRQPDLLTVGGGLLLIGGAIGLGSAFALARNADYSGAELAMAGWAGCAIPLVLQVFVAFVAYSPPTPDPSARIYIDPESVLALVCGLAFVAAITIGVTVVPLGGMLGDWLRGQAR
jgi:hypothetical protein